jgi:hypothetical protein
MLIVGALDFFEGLIAVIRDKYFVLAPSQVIVFDVTTWGWLTLITGGLVAWAGWGLLTGAGWARWFTIVVAGVAIFEQLGFVGSSQYPLWSLAVLAFLVIVVYALIVKWDEATVQQR